LFEFGWCLKNIWKVKNIKYSDHQFFDLLANLIYQPKALSSKIMKNEFRWFYIDSKYEGSECIPKKWHTNMFGICGFLGMKFCIMMTKKISNEKCTKSFFFIKYLPCFEEKIIRSNHIQTMSSWRSQKQNKILYSLHFLPNLAHAPLVDDGQSKLLHNIEKEKACSKYNNNAFLSNEVVGTQHQI